jgi:short-subunit dehydrogenase
MSRGPKLKPISEQTIVITGASSGIGLATARMAAARGAQVVLTSRNSTDLSRAVVDITRKGGRAVWMAADVADAGAVDRIGDLAVRTFGGFDTWVNNAGVSIYGRLTEVPLEDKRRLFETNFWGTVHGCRTAVRHLSASGGALINIGSVVSDVAIPLQGMYSASKHAIQAYTAALRMELERDGVPISVTLVKPSAINTPYVEHARNYMNEAPGFPPPVYAAEVVAEAILKCAAKRIPEITVGGAGRLQTVLNTIAPRTSELVMERTMFAQQKDRSRPAHLADSLHEPRRDGRVSGPYQGHVMRSSLYTRAMLSDVARTIPFVAAGAVLAAGARRWRRTQR